MHAMPLVLIVLACLAIAYRFYSTFLAAKVVALPQIARPGAALALRRVAAPRRWRSALWARPAVVLHQP